jgi:hypothetical protein
MRIFGSGLWFALAGGGLVWALAIHCVVRHWWAF